VNDSKRVNGGVGGRPAIKAAIISADPQFREELVAILQVPETGVEVELHIAVGFTDIADSHLEELRRLKPDLAFLDLESDPHVGLKFAQFMVDQSMASALIGAGSTDSPELLLQAMQAGITEYVGKPLGGEAVRDAIERVLRKSGRRAEGGKREPGQVLSLFAAKGGSGSTTVAANLAIEIHRLTRKRTLLVDLDLELGETALLLGIEPRFSVIDLMRNFHRVDSGLLASYIQRHATGLEILSAPYQPADYEAVSAERVRQVFAFLHGHYDYIIVDCPKTFTPATQAAFEEADQVFLITTADIPSVRNLSRSLPLLRSFGRRKPDPWIHLIVNRFDPKDVVSVSEIERSLGMDVYWTLRNDYRAVMTSINAGKPAVMEAKSHFAKDIRALAAKITGVRAAQESKSWLSGILGRDGRPTEPSRTKVKANE
jgi:pilus assembly protein CpaE